MGEDLNDATCVANGVLQTEGGARVIFCRVGWGCWKVDASCTKGGDDASVYVEPCVSRAESGFESEAYGGEAMRYFFFISLWSCVQRNLSTVHGAILVR